MSPDDELEDRYPDLRFDGTSEGGSRMVHYPNAPRRLEPTDPSDSVREAIVEHLAHHGVVADEVFHEVESSDVHLDVHIAHPSEAYPWTILFTTGMSDRPMTAPAGAEGCTLAELMIHLPEDWPLDPASLRHEEHYWPIRMLKGIARFPHQYASWVWDGHTIPAGGPVAPNTKLAGAILLHPQGVPPEAAVIETHRGAVHLLEIHPLHENEMQLKIDRGVEALLDRFVDKDLSLIVDPKRRSVVRRRLWPF